MITNTPFEGTNHRPLEKSVFFYGDLVTVSDKMLHVDEHKWVREINGIKMFLPGMARSYSLAYLQKLSIPHHMNWNITRGQGGLVC